MNDITLIAIFLLVLLTAYVIVNWGKLWYWIVGGGIASLTLHVILFVPAMNAYHVLTQGLAGWNP